MTNKEFNRKYPLLAVRLKKKDMDYLRQEAKERKLSINKYIRAILFPFAEKMRT